MMNFNYLILNKHRFASLAEDFHPVYLFCARLSEIDHSEHSDVFSILTIIFRQCCCSDEFIWKRRIVIQFSSSSSSRSPYFVRWGISILRDCILDFSTNVLRVAEIGEIRSDGVSPSCNALPSAFSISNLRLRVGNNRSFLGTKIVVVALENDFVAKRCSYFQHSMMQKSNKIIEFFVNFLTWKTEKQSLRFVVFPSETWPAW